MRTYQMNAYMNDETEDHWFNELFLKHYGDTRSTMLIMWTITTPRNPSVYWRLLQLIVLLW